MDKIDPLNQVAEFHRAFGHPVQAKPNMPTPDRSQLRINLLSEELEELSQAVANNDIVEVADALCDLQYVLSGAVLEFGLGEKFTALFNEVQRSNMSKACATEEEAQQTIAHYKSAKQTDSYYKKIGNKYLVYRSSDNKTLKSIKYSPANLLAILSED